MKVNGWRVIDECRLPLPDDVGIGTPQGAEVYLLACGVVAVSCDSGTSMGFHPEELRAMLALVERNQ